MIRQIELKECLEYYRGGLQPSRHLVKQEDQASVNARIIRNYDVSPESLMIPINAGELVSLKPSTTLLRHILKSDDVIVTTKFTNQAWAAVVPVNTMPTPLYAYNNIVVLHPNTSLISAAYLTLWIRSRTGETTIKKSTKKYGITYSFSLDTLVNLTINLPGVAHQQELVKYYEETTEISLQYEKTIRQRKADLRHKFSAIG